MNEPPQLVSLAQATSIRVVLVEDDEELRGLLSAGLASRGLQVIGLPSAEQLYRHLAVNACEVVVVDIGLPGEDGYSVTAHLRQLSSVGIVLLTARGGDAAMARGLKSGADVFLTKPVDCDVLAASILNLHGRLADRAVAPRLISPEPRTAWSLVADGWTLRGPRGVELPLVEAERAFLQPLFEQAGQIVAREKVIAALTSEPWNFDPHRLDVLLHRLRARVKARFDLSLPVRAIRGVGFLLVRDLH